MCRLMVYLGTPCILADLVTKPSRSLTRQSYDAKERLTGHGYLNGDGFGVGWYSPEALNHDPTPCIFSSIQPAWNNRNLERLAAKIISPLIFAHVRAAYPGIPVSDSNCQPFSCGRYMWMHNGGIGGFHIVRRALLRLLRDDVYQKCPSFESDSAIAFALFLNQMADPMEEKAPEELAAMMQATINSIVDICTANGFGEELSLLNFVVSDGKTVVASRYSNLESEQPASLYYASGSKFECANSASNQYYVRHSDRRGLLGIVASEPLTDESADWIQVPRNNMVVMTRYKGEFVDVILVPINPSPAVGRDISRSFKALASCGSGDVASAPTGPRLERKPSGKITKPMLPPGIPVTTQPRHSMTGHSKAVLALAVHGDKVFTGSQDGLIKLHDLKDFKSIRTLSGHSQTIFALTTHNHRLYSSSTRVVKIWDLDTFQLLTTLRHSDGDVFALALAQGRAVAGPAGTSIVRCNRLLTAKSYVRATGGPQPEQALPRAASFDNLRDSVHAPFAHVRSAREGYGSDSDNLSNSRLAPRPRPPPTSPPNGLINGEKVHPERELFPPVTPPQVSQSATFPVPELDLANSHQRMPPRHPIEVLKSSVNSGESSPITIPAKKSPRSMLTSQLAASEPPPQAQPSQGCPTSPAQGAHGRLGTSPSLPAGWQSCGKETEPTLVLTDTERMGHCSRVYALAMCDPLLCSGAGDGFVKVWNLETGSCEATLYGHKGGVMALAALTPSPTEEGESDSNWRLLSGSRDNTIRVWDLGTLCCITTITGHTDDVLGLCIGFRDEFYSVSSDQTVRMWSSLTYECLRIFLCEEGTFLSVACTGEGVLTGSSDGIIRFWEVDTADTPVGRVTSDWEPSTSASLAKSNQRKEISAMEDLLRQFVSIATVSADRSKAGQDQAWKGAKFLVGLLEDLGAEAKLVVAADNTNPVVFGRLVQDPSRTTVTISGHYDVQAASEEGWATDPFELAAIDGYLYGRGVSDCKGPIIAMLGAIKELVASGELTVNLIFVFDGMNENGSLGFREAVQANLEWFEGTQLILTSNSAWLSDHHPCLTYGMRGLICLSVEVSGPSKDLHSGSDGGAFNEPANDLITVLSNLVDSNNMILVPGFYDDVKELDEEEEALYEGLTFSIGEYKASSGLQALTGHTSKEVLMNRWRNPSLSIVGIETTATGWSTIPKSCTGKVAIRHVPNQEPAKVVEKVRAHVNHEFAKLRSGNRIEVRVHHVGDWWLADPHNHFYRTAEKAISRQWGKRPMYVREGGTMPVVAFLEKALGAPALQLPISQASDHMALNNEKLRWNNFIKGKDVVQDLLRSLGKSEWENESSPETSEAGMPVTATLSS